MKICGLFLISFLIAGSLGASNSSPMIARLTDLGPRTAPAPPQENQPLPTPEVSTKDLTPQVLEDLKADLSLKISEPFKLELDHDIHVQGGIGFTTKNITFDSQHHRVVAEIHFHDPAYAPLKISGHIILMTEIPVPRHSIRPGEPITAQDLIMTEVPLKRVTKATVASMESIIGTEARLLPLRPGIPIRVSDIIRPQMVKRGSLVDIQLVTSTMALQLRGTALDQGSSGDVIRVMNTDSQRILNGRVMGPNLIQIEKQATLVSPELRR